MLTESRRPGRCFAGGLAHLVGEPGRHKFAATDGERLEEVARGELGVGNEVGHGVHGRQRDAELLGGVVDLLLGLVGGPLAQRRAHLRLPGLPVEG